MLTKKKSKIGGKMAAKRECHWPTSPVRVRKIQEKLVSNRSRVKFTTSTKRLRGRISHEDNNSTVYCLRNAYYTDDGKDGSCGMRGTFEQLVPMVGG